MLNLREIIDPVLDALSEAEGNLLLRVVDMGEGNLVSALTQLKENHADGDVVTAATEALAELEQ
jgi:hypothetical protein